MSNQTVKPAQPGVALSEQPLLAEQWISAPKEAVFDFLVDYEKLGRWLGSFASSPQEGLAYRLTIDGDHIAAGEFLSIEPHDKVVFTWGWENFDALPPGSSTVTITLEAIDEGTQVRLRHDGLPLGPEDEHAVGWTRCLDRLVDALDGAS